VERVLAASHVDRVPVPPESSYFGELLRALRTAILQALLRGAQMLRVPRSVLIAAAVAIAIAALLLIVRAVLQRLRARRGEPGAVTVAAGSLPMEALDAAGWRDELERRLAAGLAAEALEAVWWWLARSVAGSRVLPDWTSRDLLAQAHRPTLVAPVRRLDALTYGPRPPGPDDLRSLVAGLEEALA